MFCPDVNDTSNLLLDNYCQMLRIKNYAMMCNSLFIGKPGDVDPTWLVDVRTRTSMLSNSMSTFMNYKPDIFSGVLYPFINYQTLFAAFADQRKNINGKDQWLSALNILKDSLTQAAQLTDSANLQFQRQYQNVGNIQPLIEDSIQKGWTSLASEEQTMIQIATNLGALQQEVQDVSGDLTSSDISNGKSYVQSTVKIIYSLVTAAGEMSVPYLSFASILYTIGSSAYEVITTSEKIENLLNQIEALQNKATAEAQALAATKATIQVLSNVSKNFLLIGASLPRLSQMWKDEQGKMVAAINAINSGANPSLYFDIQTMNIANATWTSLFNLVQTIQAPPINGEPVTLDTNTIKN